MNKTLRTLRTRMGRVQREVLRQLGELPERAQAKVGDLLSRTGRILTQREGQEQARRAACATHGSFIRRQGRPQRRASNTRSLLALPPSH